MDGLMDVQTIERWMDDGWMEGWMIVKPQGNFWTGLIHLQ